MGNYKTRKMDLLDRVLADFFPLFYLENQIQLHIECNLKRCDVASKLRQLIEQLFEIRMSEDLQFALKQVVWASTDQYPPWPAKIVRKLHHNGKTVYKVHFFADPTYSYLHSTSLLPFNGLDCLQSQSVERNLKLKKALELAKFSVSKQFHSIDTADRQVGFKLVSNPNLLTAFDQSRILYKEDIDLPQKITQLSRNIGPQTTSDGLIFDQILPENVLQLLDSYQKGQIAQRVGNLKRKQIISFQNHLKQNLLLKYKLNAVDFLKPIQKSQQPSNSLLEDFRTAKIQKKKNKVEKFDQKAKCIRKIQKILHQKGMQRHLSCTATLKIMQEIQKRASESLKPVKSSEIRQESIKLIQQISSNIQQIRQMELEYILKHILSFLDIEFHQNKLEEGSRMTQICEEFGV